MYIFAMMKYQINFGGEQSVDVELESAFSGTVEGKPMSLDVHDNGDGKLHIISGSRSFQAEILSAQDKAYKIKVGNHVYELNLQDEHDALLKRLGMESAGSSKAKDLKAPMPGMVLDILIEAGQEVSKNDPLIILEAMKMENVIKSPADGMISRVSISTGQAVEKNELLIEFD